MKKFKILFDFDSTLCKVETIPYVASTLLLHCADQISEMTDFSIISTCNYEENLRKRIDMMKGISIKDFVDSLTADLLRSDLVEFIVDHRNICAIASCNLDCWVYPLISHLNIPCHLSKASVSEGRLVDVEYILDKAEVVEKYQQNGYFVVFVGDSANDFNAMRKADVAFLLSKEAVDKDNIDAKINVIFSEKDLINQLESILI